MSAVPPELVWFTHCTKMHFGSTPASKCTQDVRHAISWREEPIWWWSMPECGEEATKQALQNRDHDFGDTAWAAETVFWPIQFRPVYFRPSCFGPGQFWPIQFWPIQFWSKLVFWWFHNLCGRVGWGLPKCGARRVGGPKISRCFFTFPPYFRSFSLFLSGVLLIEFWWGCF